LYCADAGTDVIVSHACPDYIAACGHAAGYRVPVISHPGFVNADTTSCADPADNLKAG